jgi:hypothetical protein
MTNVIVKGGIVVHATNDAIALPNSTDMIEFSSLLDENTIRVGGGDINITNSALYSVETIPEDYEGGKYLFDGEVWSLDPNYG